MKLQKITDSSEAAQKRRYDDACAATHGMDIIGERWALPVMRELMLGPRRFSELRKSLPAISANVLTQRLTGLEEAGIVTRSKLPPPISVQVYGLTPWGQEAGPVFQALGRWAARSPRHDPTRPFSAVSLMLSLRTMIDPARARGLTMRIGFHLGEEAFFLTIDDGAVAIGRGAVERPDLVMTGVPSGVAAAVYAGVPLDDLARDGLLAVEGDRALAAHFATLFPIPAKAPPGVV
ncbi:winged helix-turn-helix transcriptional regulator [Sphingomonas colocasiae]|uniref:Winged helix-turn-helix transcriptional regulator n=1 Tax=Sphingomonas colocasiae TaxID=1848973 RepID=A0ABS7PLC4_9SPHN|nr:winged helix-turn-helix transcriptional regulator [Sphingomonas colocasiae]MBY8822043.1 winged helix-turn-helix transcriptional regulator [Sphingomonas colocasiae]